MWGIQSAMDKPRPEKTTFLIMVSPLTGKYVRDFDFAEWVRNW